MEKIYQNEEWLREKYWEEGLTMHEMADEANCGSTTIKRWMDKHDIERRNGGAQYVRPAESKLRRLYFEEEMTVGEIAEKFDVSHTAALKWMDDYGIERRSSAESRDLRGTGGNQWEHGPHREEKWLREKYHGEHMTVAEMAEEAGVTEASIVRNMQKNGVESRKPHISRVLRDPGAGFVHADARGYEMVKHSVGDHTYNFPIHRLLAMAEYGIDEVKGKVVHHKNGIKWDNRPENLGLFDSQSDHMSHHTEYHGFD